MLRFLRTPRLWLGLVITLCWLIMMGLLVMRNGGRPGSVLRKMGVSSEVLMVSWADYDHWVWVRSNDRTLGLSHLAVQPSTGFALGDNMSSSEPSYEMNSRTRLRFQMMGMALPLDIAMSARMNTAFEMKTLQMRLQIADQQVDCQAFTEDDSLYYRLRIAPAESPLDLPESLEGDNAFTAQSSVALAGILPSRDLCGRTPLKGPVLMSNVLMPVITRSEKLKKGIRWTTHVSDPIGGMLDMPVEVTVQDKEEVKVGDLTYEAWKMIEKVGSMQSTVWYDTNGRLLRQEMSNGLELLRVGKLDDALEYDPEFRRRPNYPPLDREYIYNHLDPDLVDQPLTDLLPGLPTL